jgi:hypothetical protein
VDFQSSSAGRAISCVTGFGGGSAGAPVDRTSASPSKVTRPSKYTSLGGPARGALTRTMSPRLKIISPA